ncbi:glycosyltransferase [Streptococcus saliviloxodontae]|uniref:Glycosyltransferase involved in cell wall biosynthesis n=1 Tax=Streptococcus saliviloxodontae TaxID=1349416 RepID=A0ABS2PKM5_9STRE|nr:glycosyltransferase [Streptococcus saliviloxodontae]MBM7635985.1 glycosyltransferase involved in cell wall biosynthesis [Streptococcus saliviloxodontae]
MTKFIDASVVLATYNGEEFLLAQLNSIINQTKVPREIVFLDDGSTDATLKIIDTFCRNLPQEISIQKILRETNIGYIKNFLDGIDRANFDTIFLCDQDDLWEVNKVEKILDFFESHNDCIALHSNTKIIDQNDRVIKENGQEYHGVQKISLENFITKVNYPGMALAFKKDKIGRELQEINLSGIQLPTHDWVICYLASLQNGFFTSDIVLTRRRYTGKNVALQLEPQNGKESRIDGINLYMTYYHFVDEYQKIASTQIIDTKKLIDTSEIRVNYLEKNSVMKWLFNIKSWRYYPSFKSYLNDGIFIFKDKKNLF